MRQVRLSELTQSHICGIYLLTFPNGKVYVGQAQNIYSRIREHNQRAKKGNHGDKAIQVCERAIQKYGEIEEFIILEDNIPLTELDARESYWIAYYNATDREKGYNILDDGNVSGKRGVEHINAAFTKETLEEVVDLIINHRELSFIEIANRYGVEQNTILRISTGKIYFNPALNYPLRRNDHTSLQKIEWQEYFSSIEVLLALKEDLKYSWDLDIDNDLTSKYNIPLRIVRDINQGRRYSNIGDYTYPIRTGKSRSILSKSQVLEILNLLRTTSMSMTTIGDKFKINRSTVSCINRGTTFYIKDYDYPARKT